MKIELAVSCHYFQKRFCWMLSSILQQVGELPEIEVSVAYIKNKGNPTIEEIVDCFQYNGLSIQSFPYEDESRFQYRGLVRTDMLQKSDADWIWFGDCDMVINPEFFNSAMIALSSDEYKDCDKCLYTGRHSTMLDETEDLVDEFDYPKIIDRAWEMAYNLESVPKSNIGAGFCQIVNVKQMREKHGGYYINKVKDNSWDKFWKTRSDSHFRRRVGKKKIDLPWFIHFQHRRDNEVGRHIEIQR